MRDRRVQAPPSGNNLRSLEKPAPGWADCAPAHGWEPAITSRKDSWKGLFLSWVPLGQTRWHSSQHSASRWCSASCAFRASQLMSRSLILMGQWAGGKGDNLIQTVYWDLHIPQRTKNDSLLPKHFREEWCFISKCGLFLRCLISVSFLPEAATQRKWPSKGMIFCFTQSLLSWGCFFCFLSSILFLPSPLQNKKDHTSHQDLSSREILFFSSFDNFLFIRRKSMFLFFFFSI